MKLANVMLITALYLPSCAPSHSDASKSDVDTCTIWAGSPALENVVNTTSCLDVTPGTYTIQSPIAITSDVVIHGNGAIFKAESPFIGGHSTMFLVQRNSTGTLTMENATLDANGVTAYAILEAHFTLDNVTMKNAVCSAVGIAGVQTIVRNSTMTHNGFGCSVYSGLPLGAAIYVQHTSQGYYWAPIITGNMITDSNGPGLDINGAWGGTFSNNVVSGNTGWAAVSLYGASYWTLNGNHISEPVSTAGQGSHPYCDNNRPYGVHSVAIFLCQDSQVAPYLTNYDTITNNSASGYYGILLVGADEIAPWETPRLITITGNNVLGSSVGCADDFQIGQWYTDSNTWTNNNCAGTPNTQPVRY